MKRFSRIPTIEELEEKRLKAADVATCHATDSSGLVEAAAVPANGPISSHQSFSETMTRFSSASAKLASQQASEDEDEDNESDDDSDETETDDNDSDDNNNDSDETDSDDNESDGDSNDNDSDDNESDDNESDDNESDDTDSDETDSDDNESDDNESDDNESSDNESDDSDDNETDDTETTTPTSTDLKTETFRSISDSTNTLSNATLSNSAARYTESSNAAILPPNTGNSGGSSVATSADLLKADDVTLTGITSFAGLSSSTGSGTNSNTSMHTADASEHARSDEQTDSVELNLLDTGHVPQSQSSAHTGGDIHSDEVVANSQESETDNLDAVFTTLGDDQLALFN
jgi:hypothetical protein